MRKTGRKRKTMNEGEVVAELMFRPLPSYKCSDIVELHVTYYARAEVHFANSLEPLHPCASALNHSENLTLQKSIRLNFNA